MAAGGALLVARRWSVGVLVVSIGDVRRWLAALTGAVAVAVVVVMAPEVAFVVMPAVEVAPVVPAVVPAMPCPT